MLEGITRRTVLEIAAAELGLPVLERSVDRSELYMADEVFECGTGAQITPVREVDDRVVGDGVRDTPELMAVDLAVVVSTRLPSHHVDVADSACHHVNVSAGWSGSDHAAASGALLRHGPRRYPDRSLCRVAHARLRWR